MPHYTGINHLSTHGSVRAATISLLSIQTSKTLDSNCQACPLAGSSTGIQSLQKSDQNELVVPLLLPTPGMLTLILLYTSVTTSIILSSMPKTNMWHVALLWFQ